LAYIVVITFRVNEAEAVEAKYMSHHGSKDRDMGVVLSNGKGS
jgi:hypothetical protein